MYGGGADVRAARSDLEVLSLELPSKIRNTVMLSKNEIFLLVTFHTFQRDFLHQISISWWVLKSSCQELFKTHPGSLIWSILGWVIWILRKVGNSDPASASVDSPCLVRLWDFCDFSSHLHSYFLKNAMMMYDVWYGKERILKKNSGSGEDL